MTKQQLIDWRSQIETDIEHLRAFIALPDAYFSPKGGQHWYQVTSRSEIEAALARQMRMVAHINNQLMPAYAKLVELADAARPTSDDDWGSERQIAAENAFFAAIGPNETEDNPNSVLGQDFYRWCLKATSEEMIDEALRRLRVRRPGARVRLTADVAPYPLGSFPAGTTGTVVEINPGAPVGNPVGFIKLDQHFDCLNEWDNVLQVFRPEDGLEVTWSLFGQEG